MIKCEICGERIQKGNFWNHHHNSYLITEKLNKVKEKYGHIFEKDNWE